MDDVDEDIYGGIDEGVKGFEVAELTERAERAEAAASAETREKERALDEVARLREVNSTLERNISVLFNTAMAEIKRKDAEISAMARHAQR
eukprot:CAMPEP_0119273548 /NCGR_PEP_ID=MMETSP1329-20130426/10644_1 /TAXON_ID=114041 /ORGANISM="Genus nov. species nov., Strain RCC1024" /LENGTH=90 /DNA_ID=CAMNT_0007273777 /DNA_START=151 /DNA_END=423 /DNA_ORIENTATION=+